MFFRLVLFGALLSAHSAFGAEVYSGATANVTNLKRDPITETDYGGPTGTGGGIFALGAYWPEGLLAGVPLELRFQRSVQNTAWNDNRAIGETQYRDGYQIYASEVLIGTRWEYDPRVFFSILLGGGQSQITYKTRENRADGATSEFTTQARHITGQIDLRYAIPTELKNVEFALDGMLRLSVLGPHPTFDEVPRTTWSINLPTLPIPSVGLWVSVKL